MPPDIGSRQSLNLISNRSYKLSFFLNVYITHLILMIRITIQIAI